MANKIDETFDAARDRILASLEEGVAPWTKPWAATGHPLPWNLSTNKEYRGLTNAFLLMVHGQCRTSNAWIGVKQALAMGGRIRREEWKKSVNILVPLISKKKLSDGSEESRFYGFRTREVYNFDQTEGLELPKVELKEHDPIETAEAIVASYEAPPSILWTHDGNRAYYSPAEDKVVMPPRGAFETPTAVYATLFHELGHSTGHANRLAREGVTSPVSFGSHRYSQEELVAELTSAYLCALAGIETEEKRSAEYIGSWLKALKNDRNMVHRAAVEANRATRLIAGNWLAARAKEEAKAA